MLVVVIVSVRVGEPQDKDDLPSRRLQSYQSSQVMSRCHHVMCEMPQAFLLTFVKSSEIKSRTESLGSRLREE